MIAAAKPTMRAAWVTALFAALAACQSTKDLPPARDVPPPPVPAAPAGPQVLQAPFRSTGGSAVTGAAVVKPIDGGINVAVTFGGMGAGWFRVVIHEYGNCTSNNAFSAGPAWSPPGVQQAIQMINKNDDTTTNTFRLPGYAMTGVNGVDGRSVVVHWGLQGALDAQPGVPNDRVACGVIGLPHAGIFDLLLKDK